MRTIHKYSLAYGSGAQTFLSMPEGAQILDAQMQGQALMLWASVLLPKTSEQGLVEVREFLVMGTGNQYATSNLKYISTVQDGVYVWHVFEVPQ